MKQVLKAVALTLCTLGLLACCKKKGGDPTPSPTPIDPGKSLTLTLAPNATTFVLGGLTGQDVIVEGAKAAVVAPDGNVEEWSFFEGAKQVKHTFTATPGATIKIKGNVKSIAILEGLFEDINLSNAPSTFTGFCFFEDGEGKSTSLSKINVGINPNIENFFLGVNPGETKGGPEGLRSLKLDLSGLTNVKELGLYVTQGEVTFPKSLNKLKRFFADQVNMTTFPAVTTANFPELVRFTLRGSNSFSGRDINLAGHTKLQRVSLTRSPFGNIDLSNIATLNYLTFKEGTIKGLNLLNTPKLDMQRTVSTLPKSTGEFKSNVLTDAQKQAVTNLGWKIVTQ